MHDRAMQALYLLALDPIAETTADPNSYGFRKERCCADAIQQCHTVLANRNAAAWILEGDIKACFDQISHDWLLAHVPMDKAILRKWLQAGSMDQHVFHETAAGTPQGGIISPGKSEPRLGRFGTAAAGAISGRHCQEPPSASQPGALCRRLHHYEPDARTPRRRSPAARGAVPAGTGPGTVAREDADHPH